MLYILFGPPGMGKSTIIRSLKSEHHGMSRYHFCDLENFRSTAQREHHLKRLRQLNLLEPLDWFVVGGADIDPSIITDPVIERKVLLWAPQEVYDERRWARDRSMPGKANQHRHSVDRWLDFRLADIFRWDMLNTEHMTPKQETEWLENLFYTDWKAYNRMKMLEDK